MKTREIALPASAEERTKVLRSCEVKCNIYSVFFFIFLAIAVVGLIGALVSVLVYELNSSVSDALGSILIGSFFGGGAVAGGIAVLLTRLLSRADLMRLDFAERCASEHSFYVGEGTLATFEAENLLLHSDRAGGKSVRVPYGSVRLFSVCTRRAPKEKGEWSVVIELPARFLAKDGKAKEDEKVLIQTDAKERLFRTIELRGLTLLGEDQRAQDAQNKSRYRLKTKFYVPDTDKRRRFMVMTILGAVAAGAGIPVAIFWNIMAGSFLSVIGCFLAVRFASAFVNAKSLLSVYEEGIFWRDKTGTDRMFLKWGEIEKISREEGALKVGCIYGDYQLPDIAGAFEYLERNFPDKCG